MFKDHIRMVAYENGIKRLVQPGMTVVGVDTGTGILAQWALEAGAVRIILFAAVILAVSSATNLLSPQ
jgi:type I protein arginine methyltransferase